MRLAVIIKTVGNTTGSNITERGWEGKGGNWGSSPGHCLCGPMMEFVAGCPADASSMAASAPICATVAQGSELPYYISSSDKGFILSSL